MQNVSHLRVLLLFVPLGVSCTFVVMVALGQDASLPTYASIRQEVEVGRLDEDPRNRPRPASFFQLAGVANEQLCDGVLAAFNEPGDYDGDHDGRWLLGNSREIQFQKLRAPGAAEGASVSVVLGLEYLSVDFDANGENEHVYRLESVLSGRKNHRLLIVEEELQSRPELLVGYEKRCTRMDPSARCGETNTKIRYALTAPGPERLDQEWLFTKRNILSATTGSAEPRRLIFVGRKQAPKNFGTDTGAYWSLYDIGGKVLAVAAPNLDFAPPELLVFLPEQQRVGILQCVLMPVAWHELP